MAAGRRWLPPLLAVGLALTPLGAIAATTWQATAGAQSADRAIQVEQFLPNDLTVDVGDTITWTVPTAEPHTITFLSGNPAPAFTAPASGGPTYNGTGVVNSGLIAGGATFSVTFTATGNFPFVCLLHPPMTGTVHVNAAGAPYPNTQAFYDQQAQQQAAQSLNTGAQLSAQGLAAAQSAGVPSVTAGAGNGVVDVMRFLPGTITVPVGGTVTFTNRATGTPHTVTFGAPPANIQAPAGTDSAGHATLAASGQSTSSGFIGAGQSNGTDFRVAFSAAGTYSYVCLLHADLGMTGTVVVSPAAPTPVIPELPPLWLFGSGLLALGAALGLGRRARRT